MKKEFITKVNDKINDLIMEHEGLLSVLGSTYNLKLHDIAYEANEEDYNEYFELFCNINYQVFEKFTKENDCNLIQVGRTSSFLIADNEGIIDKYKCYDLQQSNNNFEKIIVLLDCYLSSEYTSVGFNISDMFTIDYNRQSIEDAGSNLMDFFAEYKEYLNGNKSPLEIFIEGFNNFIEEYFYGITEVADYINNFKENQLKLWNEFIEEQKEMEEDWNEFIEEQKEMEEE